MRFATPQGFNSGDQFEAYLRDSFDCLLAEGEAGAPKMMSVGLHCRLVGRPGRVMALRRFLEYAQGHRGVWFATRLQIAEHWAREHPPAARTRPSEMDRGAFVAAYGGVFEHSPWIAERAHALEFGPAHDTAGGLQAMLARVFRSASEEERLGVLTAHPDLSGKLAQAKRLTSESTAEQASAGLDTLTDAERARFAALNATYVEKHGFPFIIAVRDHDKAGILAAFERRIANDRATESAEACRQVERIAAIRLADMLPE
jgi:OHCU decarboxylase